MRVNVFNSIRRPQCVLNTHNTGNQENKKGKKVNEKKKYKK